MEEEKKRKGEMQTGGGFDIGRFRIRSSNHGSSNKSSDKNNIEAGEILFPEISRPGSKRVFNLPRPSQFVAVLNAESRERPHSKEGQFSARTTKGFKIENDNLKASGASICVNSPDFGNLTTSNFIPINTARKVMKRGTNRSIKK